MSERKRLKRSQRANKAQRTTKPVKERNPPEQRREWERDETPFVFASLFSQRSSVCRLCLASPCRPKEHLSSQVSPLPVLPRLKSRCVRFLLSRDAFCAPVLYIAAAAMEGGLHLPRLIELPFFFLLGLLGMFGNQYFYIQVSPRCNG